MVGVSKRKDLVMNANPASAASAAPALRTVDLRASGPVQSLERLDAYRVSLDACRLVAPIAGTLSASLRDQLMRASSSVVLNVAEGFGSSSRGIKRRHYEIARGSAIECVAVLDIASTLGAGSEDANRAAALAAARSLFTRAAMMLAKLAARFR